MRVALLLLLSSCTAISDTQIDEVRDCTVLVLFPVDVVLETANCRVEVSPN